MSSNSPSHGFVPLFGGGPSLPFERMDLGQGDGSSPDGSGFVPLFGAPALGPPKPRKPLVVTSEAEPSPEPPPVVTSEGEEIAEAAPPMAEGAPDEPLIEDGEQLREREEGFEVGRRAGLEAGREELERRTKALDAALQEVAGLRQRLLRQTVDDIAAATVEISRRLVRRELSIGVGDVDGLVREILDDLRADDDITVHIAPEDDRAMREGYPGFLAHVGRDASLRVEASPSITPGGILIETEFGSVDATVEARFDAFAEAVQAWATEAVEAIDA